jgi:hypothetical protein
MRTKDNITKGLEDMLLKMIVGGLLAFIFVQFIVTAAHAQQMDAIDAEQEVEITTVDQRSKGNETKVVGISARVDALEAAQGTIPPALDVTMSLENATVTIPRIVARDSLGNFVGSWFDRSAVSVGFYDLPGVGELRFRVTPDAIKWVGAIPSNGLTYYTNSTCGADGSSPVQKTGDYGPADLDSGDWFGGLHELFVNTRPDGSVWFSRLDTSVTITSGDLFQKSATGCPFKVRGADIHPAVHVAEAPFFVPPFTVGVEQ